MDLSDYMKTVLQRIEARYVVCTASGCWNWCARTSRNGYGRICVEGVERAAHRVLYEIKVGPIPEGAVLDHLCRNRACVNPAHMDPVSIRINTLRGEGPTAKRWGGNDVELWP